jgi:AcrR family transcriptional regulator
MKNGMQVRKRKLVEDAIYDAAIDLFAKKGFDETTIDEIAEGSGISRRSFFRYFGSKNDLLARNTIKCGEVVRQTAASCARDLSVIDVIAEVVLKGAEFSEQQPRTLQIIQIAEKSASAAQAHLSRLSELEIELAEVYSRRLKSGSHNHLEPRLLSALSWALINASITSWFSGEHKDIQSAARQAVQDLTKLFCRHNQAPSSSPVAKSAKETPGTRTQAKKSAKK